MNDRPPVINYCQPYPRQRQRWRLRGIELFRLVVGTLIVIFVIVAAGIYWLVSTISAPSSVRFHFRNLTPNQIESLVFTHSEGASEIGPIAPGAAVDIKVPTAFRTDYLYAVKAGGTTTTGKVCHWNDDDDEGYTKDWYVAIDPLPGGGVKISSNGRDRRW